MHIADKADSTILTSIRTRRLKRRQRFFLIVQKRHTKVCILNVEIYDPCVYLGEILICFQHLFFVTEHFHCFYCLHNGIVS